MELALKKASLLNISTRNLMGITKPFTHLHPVPSTSTQLHPPPTSSFHQSQLSSLEHPQQYLNQNIARNRAIFPFLGRKIKKCQFCLKIGTHGILEVLDSKSRLKFLKFRLQNSLWTNLGPKI